MILTREEQENIRKAVEEEIPEDSAITGKLWTLGRKRHRWGTSCQRPVKRAQKQNPEGI